MKKLKKRKTRNKQHRFEHQMTIARAIMKKRRVALRELANK
jgi:hypothetical protein